MRLEDNAAGIGFVISDSVVQIVPDLLLSLLLFLDAGELFLLIVVYFNQVDWVVLPEVLVLNRSIVD